MGQLCSSGISGAKGGPEDPFDALINGMHKAKKDGNVGLHAATGKKALSAFFRSFRKYCGRNDEHVLSVLADKQEQNPASAHEVVLYGAPEKEEIRNMGKNVHEKFSYVHVRNSVNLGKTLPGEINHVCESDDDEHAVCYDCERYNARNARKRRNSAGFHNNTQTVMHGELSPDLIARFKSEGVSVRCMRSLVNVPIKAISGCLNVLPELHYSAGNEELTVIVYRYVFKA